MTTFSVTSGDTLTICATHPQVDDTGEKAKWMFSEEPELHDSDYGWVYYRDSQQSGVYSFTLQVNADANLICAGYAHAALNSSDITDSSVLTHALEKFKYVRIQGNLDLAGPLNVEGDHELLLGYNTTLDNNTHTIDGTLKLRGAKLNLPSASSVLKVNGSIDSTYSSLSVGGTMDIKNMLTADANTSLQIDDTGVLNNYGFTRVYDVKNAGTIHNISGKFVLGSGGVIDNTNGIIKTESGAVFVKLGTIKGNAVDGSVTDTDPDELLTRLGVAEMIYKAATGDTTLSSAGSYAASAPADTAGLIDVERGVIGYCLNAGYVSTDESGNYNPNQTITRAQTASYLTSLAGNRMPPSDENYRLILAAIPDVSESAWYAQYVIRLYQAGIIGSGNFNPNAWITVAQAQRWIDAVQDLAKGEGTVTKTYTDGSKIGISGVDYDYVGPVKSDPQLNAAMTFYYRSSTKEVVYIKYSSGGAAFAFLPGYPMVIANSFDAGNGAYVQISVVSNKDCRLYYALYPEGGIEPTGQQFISGNLGQPVRSDKLNLLAKQGEIINLNGLKERTDYDLYLWLSDDNNDLSCAVQKLSFTTADGSAPAFRYGTPSVSDITSDSISLTVNVSEDATVYWVAVKAGTEYLKSDTSWSDAQWAANAVRQIESGTNSIAHGKASVQANTDAAIDIDGLDPATSYDIYFVALDSSGNYSQLVKGSPDTYMLTAETQSAGSVQVVLRSISTTSIKDSSGADIPIDMAFSLIPVFTNTASSVCWDMILWADASCKLQIYELSDGLPSATGNLISSSSGGAADASFVPAAGGDKIGHSLSRDYQGQASFPSVNGSLQNGQAKYYGIHITQLNGIDEEKDGSGRKKWDGTINVNVSVLTGTETELNGLPSSITETSLNTYKAGTNIAEIHSQNPFSMSKLFTNTIAPGFAAGFPLVTNVTDTTATIRVALDSAGTLYYVVAPVTVNATSGSTSYAPAILTTLDQNGAAVSITDKSINSIPESGNQPAFAQQPAPDRIYTPSFSNDAIQSGKLSMSTSYNDISLSTLQPDTLYFVYFVTKGQGQIYSEQVMLYQFKTN